MAAISPLAKQILLKKKEKKRLISQIFIDCLLGEEGALSITVAAAEEF